MRFLFPHSVGHLPNENQIKLLIAMTYETDVPGFLHENTLAVTKNEKENDEYIAHYITADTIKAFKGHPYLYVPYDLPKTYIMTTPSDVVGFIQSGTLLTYWFESSISLHEIYTAEGYKIPIVCKFSHIGRSESCTLCHAHGALDWVDEAKATQKYRKVPRNRFILANHRYYNFLIDNQHIIDYDGEHLIHPCPRCMGLGCDSILTVMNDKIEGMNFTANPMYHLLFRGARETLIDLPYPFT